MNYNKTKIVATMGPAVSEKETLVKLIQAGINVCRINFSHGTYEDHAKMIANIKEIRERLQVNIGILADLQGPKIRVGQVPEEGIPFEKGDILTLTTTEVEGSKKHININYKDFPRDVTPGEQVLIDDGKIVFETVSSDGKSSVKLKAIVGGVIKSRKGVNLPNTKISQPCLTEKDRNDLVFALEQGVSWVALSFVRNASDIIELKHLIAENSGSARVIAKIEKPEALADIENIIKESDGLMVARGDLGIEVPVHKVPLIQKDLVKRCMLAGKPSIIATQMMESMLNKLTPSRAEVNDVANAVMDGADAVMLSGETSVGKYPVEVIETMSRIITHSETYDGIYFKDHQIDKISDRFVSDSICESACNLAASTESTAIVTMTFSGYTAYRVSSYRPKAGVFAFTSNQKILDVLSLVWGVRGFYYDKFVSTDHTIADIKYILRKKGFIDHGDHVVNIASMPINERGRTNMIRLSKVR